MNFLVKLSDGSKQIVANSNNINEAIDVLHNFKVKYVSIKKTGGKFSKNIQNSILPYEDRKFWGLFK